MVGRALRLARIDSVATGKREMAVRVLVGCETSGIVRDAFIAKGHDAVSCDLLPAQNGGPHTVGPVQDIWDQGWDLMIIHPDCTYVCGSGWHWNHRRVGRHMLSLRAVEFFKECMAAPVPKICAENPVGMLSTYYRKPTQYIQPYEFGDDASKKTGLWLKGLEPLKADPAKRYPGRIVTWNGKRVERWSNQTDSGQNALTPSDDRWRVRSNTFKGIAKAMADQWG